MIFSSNDVKSAPPIFSNECELFAHERETNCGDERPLAVRNCSRKRRKNKKMVGHTAQKLERYFSFAQESHLCSHVWKLLVTLLQQ